MAALWPLLLAATAAIVIGTEVGTRALVRIPEQLFRRLLAALLFILGLSMLVRSS